MQAHFHSVCTKPHLHKIVTPAETESDPWLEALWGEDRGARSRCCGDVGLQARGHTRPFTEPPRISHMTWVLGVAPPYRWGNWRAACPGSPGWRVTSREVGGCLSLLTPTSSLGSRSPQKCDFLLCDVPGRTPQHVRAAGCAFAAELLPPVGGRPRADSPCTLVSAVTGQGPPGRALCGVHLLGAEMVTVVTWRDAPGVP